MTIGQGIATAGQWLSVAVIVCALATCTCLDDHNDAVAKKYCFQAGGTWDTSNYLCEPARRTALP